MKEKINWAQTVHSHTGLRGGLIRPLSSRTPGVWGLLLSSSHPLQSLLWKAVQSGAAVNRGDWRDRVEDELSVVPVHQTWTCDVVTQSTDPPECPEWTDITTDIFAISIT